MKEWLIEAARYALSDWHNLLVGGVIVMSVVIFLIGFFKKIIFDRIKNKLVRKIVLAWTSVIMALPFTAGMCLVKGFNFDYFWLIYACYAAGTILGYWLYENTGLRNGIHWIGQNTVMKLLHVRKKEDIDKVMTTVDQQVESLLYEAQKSTSKYDDDLKNL